VEIKYLIALSQLNFPQLKISVAQFEGLRNIYRNFSESDTVKIKEAEKTTNHDVKAVEYFIKEKLGQLGLEDSKEFVHFGLTSQDINNTVFPLLTKHALAEIILPALADVQKKLSALADKYAGVAMLARTHGQPASPTMLGKGLFVFY